MAVEIPDFSGKSHNNIMWRIRHFKYNPATQSIDAWNDSRKVDSNGHFPNLATSLLYAKAFH